MHTAGNLVVQQHFGVNRKGVSLRFPKFVRRRSDRDVSNCTPASIIVNLLKEATGGKA